jgi:hypothetical protein
LVVYLVAKKVALSVESLVVLSVCHWADHLVDHLVACLVAWTVGHWVEKMAAHLVGLRVESLAVH